MPRFFIDSIPSGKTVLTGADGKHIVRSLRMVVGEPLTLCDGQGTDYACEIESISGDEVLVRVLSSCASISEPTVHVTVYQGLPKADKMDSIVQKAVEIGAVAIVPVMTARCVSKPDEKSAQKKIERWQKISEEAAKQSGRGIIPRVEPLMSLKQAAQQAVKNSRVLLFYEGGGESLSKLISQASTEISIFIGPEGGFEPEEVELIVSLGGKTATLGTRILRTETAPIAAIAAIMLASGNM